MKMESVNAIANEFLNLADGSGKAITNLQLAKLCYMAQGFSLALLGSKAFPEKIEAWKLGPVIPSLYHEFKSFKNSPINQKSTVVDTENIDNLIQPKLEDESLKKVVSLVWNLYKDVPASNLVSLTHQGNTPWTITYEPDRNKIIDENLIKVYYNKFIENLETEFLNEKAKPFR